MDNDENQPSLNYGESQPLLADVQVAVSLPSPSPSPAPVPAPTFPLPSSTNFLTIVRDESIKGGYTIDPSMRVPPDAVPSVGKDGEHLNMRAASQNGSVDIVVAIVYSGDVKKPAQLQAESQKGNVMVTVVRHDYFPSLKVQLKPSIPSRAARQHTAPFPP